MLNPEEIHEWDLDILSLAKNFAKAVGPQHGPLEDDRQRILNFKETK